jgi:predicted Ser/Thr protein kinase
LWKNIQSSGGIIKGKWKVSRKVGEGAFGEIYSAVNIITLQSVAIKFEMVDTKKQVLKIEVAVLRKLQGKARAGSTETDPKAQEAAVLTSRT